MSNIINKVKDAISGHKDHSDHTDHTRGPHNTDTGNILDPRVDSSRGTTTGTYGNTSTTSDPNYYGTSGGTNIGPHDSKLANKLDPRVDSDLDGSRTAGGGNTYGGTGITGTSGGHGPHSSGIGNRVDPRVDSTTGSTGIGTTGSGYGQSGYSQSGYNQSSNSGPHGTLGNKLDPRVDSDRDGSNYGSGMGMTGNQYGSGTGMTGSSNNQTTHGPHNSDLANKLDPRVDSDLDGSRTVGGGPKYGNY